MHVEKGWWLLEEPVCLYRSREKKLSALGLQAALTVGGELLIQVPSSAQYLLASDVKACCSLPSPSELLKTCLGCHCLPKGSLNPCSSGQVDLPGLQRC